MADRPRRLIIQPGGRSGHLAADSDGSATLLVGEDDLLGLALVELDLLFLGVDRGIGHRLGLYLRRDLLEVLVPQLHRRHLQIVLVLPGYLRLIHVVGVQL